MAENLYDIRQVLGMGVSDPRDPYLLEALGLDPYNMTNGVLMTDPMTGQMDPYLRATGWDPYSGENISPYLLKAQQAMEAEARQILPENIRNMQIASKTYGSEIGRGDTARLTQEFQYLMPKTKSGSAAENAARAAADLARYGVNSLSEIKSERIPIAGGKGYTDVFYNSATGAIIPAEFGSSMQGEGGSYFSLKNANGQAVPTAAWTDTSDKQELGTIAAMFGTVLGGAALGNALLGGGSAASGVAGAEAAAAAGAAPTGFAGTAPAMGAAAGEWTLPGALSGVSGATQAAGGATLATALGSPGYAGGLFGTSGGPTGAAAQAWDAYNQGSWLDRFKSAAKDLFSPDAATRQGAEEIIKQVGGEQGVGDSILKTLQGTGGNMAGLDAITNALGGAYGLLNPFDYNQKLPDQMALAQQQSDLNRANAEWALNQNRVNQNTPFANIGWTKDANGNWVQNTNLNAADQQTLDAIRTKQQQLVGGMGGGFDVNNPVMQAQWALSSQDVQRQRDAENARLAAQGLSTGSGQAWQNAQQSLNQMQTDAWNKAIGQGFNANMALRQQNTQDYGALNQGYGMLRGNIQATPAYTAAATPGTPDFMAAQNQQLQQQQAQQLAGAQAQRQDVGSLLQGGLGLLGPVGKITGWW